MDLMADLAASGENNMELISVSSDSIPVHRLGGIWLLSISSCLRNRVWRERRDIGGPMIMLADRTGEVEAENNNGQTLRQTLRSRAPLECWTPPPTLPTTPSLSSTPAAPFRQENSLEGSLNIKIWREDIK